MEAAEAAAPEPTPAVAATASSHSASDDPEKKLKRFIAKFASYDGTGELGSGPPCRAYQSLVTLQSFHKKVQSLKEVTTELQLRYRKDHIKVFRAAIMELIACGKASARRLTSLLQHVAKQSEQAKKKKAKSVPRGSRCLKLAAETLRVSAGGDSAANAFTIISNMHTLSAPRELGAVVWDKPMKLYSRSHQQPSDLWAMDGPVQAAVTSLLNKFTTSPEYVKPGRAMRVCSKEAIAIVAEEIVQVSTGLRVVAKDQLVGLEEADLVPTVFAVAKGKETVSTEAGYFASFRLAIRGRRDLIFTCMLVWIEFLAPVGKDVQGDVGKAGNFFRNATADLLEDFERSRPSSLCYATQEPGEFIFTPPGHFVMEKVGVSEDFVGFRYLVVAKNHRAILEATNDWCNANKPNPKTQAAVNALAISED